MRMRQCRLGSAALCALLVCGALLGAAPPARGAAPELVLVADANTLPTALGSYNPEELLPLGDTIVFRGWTPQYGVELYRLEQDGRVTLVRDIFPGGEPDRWEYGPTGSKRFISALPGSLTPLGGRFAFVADDGSYGPELWVSDGSPAGTAMVRDLFPGTAGSAPAELTLYAGELVFVADDGLSGRRLYRSDGTAAGTHPVALPAPAATSLTCRLTPLGNALYFVRQVAASAGAGGSWELWRIDGAAGAVSLIAGGQGAVDCQPGATAASGGQFFFVVDGDLWRSDGTGAGTVMVEGFREGPKGMVALSERVYFSATGYDDVGEELWRSDGTPAGTLLVVDARPGPESSYPRDLAVAGDRIYFSADDGVHGREPWVSSGFITGNRMLADLNSLAGSDPAELTAVGSTIFFSAAGNLDGRELWRSEGTAATTVRVVDLAVGELGGDPRNLHSLGGLLYFGAGDGVNGHELWRTDGSAGGTLRLTDLEDRSTTDSSAPSQLTAVGGRAFFLAGSDRGGGAQRLWQSDGTPGGTTATSLPERTSQLVPLGDTLLLAGQKLWRYGAAPGAIEPMPALGLSFEPRYFARLGDRLLFVAANTDEFVDYVSELWLTDGTDGGTAKVRRLQFNDPPAALTAVGEQVLFFQGFGYTPDYAELWSTDGSAAGTELVKVIRPPMVPKDASDYEREQVALGGRLFFTIDDGVHGSELWVSDGTAQGTALLLDIVPGAEGSRPRHLTPCGPRLCFAARDGAHGWELWATDGTAPGTGLIADIFPGRGSSLPSGIYDQGWFVAAGPLVYFPANDGQTGKELWATDGTAAGTRLVADLLTGPGGALPRPLAAVAGRLVLDAYDPDHGAELWVSDGTAAGTRRVTDLAPGAESSHPGSPVAAGDRLFFSADDGAHGREIWSLLLSALEPPPGLQRARVALPLVAR